MSDVNPKKQPVGVAAAEANVEPKDLQNDDEEVTNVDTSITAEMIFSDFIEKMSGMFQDTLEACRALDGEDKELLESLQMEIQAQEEKGKQLRAQIEKAQSSIQQFMRSLAGVAMLEE